MPVSGGRGCCWLLLTTTPASLLHVYSYQLCFLVRNAVDGYEDQYEEDRKHREALRRPCDDTSFPSKDSQLNKLRDQVPARSDVPCKEDAKRQDGDGVHELGVRTCPSV